MKRALLLFIMANALISYGQNIHFPDETSYFNGLLYYKNAPFTGVLVDMYPNKKHKLETNYKDGLKDGNSIEYYSNGNRKFEGLFKAGEPDGKQTFWYESGKLKEVASYINTKRTGPCKRYFENGQIQLEENYIEGVLDGVKSEWYENGIKRKEIKYFLGNISKNIEWYSNGVKKCEIDYQNGQIKDGDYNFYDENNNLIIVTYANGAIIMEKFKDNHFISYYSDGHKKDDGYLNSNNLLNGKYTAWYPNGQMKSECYKLDGKLEGKYSEWYENGSPKSVSNYKNDQLAGETIKYDESGGKTVLMYSEGKVTKKMSQNETNLISRNLPTGNRSLYYCLSGDDHDTTFIMVTIEKSNSNDQYLNLLATEITYAIDNRFHKMSNYEVSAFRDKYLSYFYVISNLMHSTENVNYKSICYDNNFKAYNCTKTGYIGSCSYTINITDANGNNIYYNGYDFKVPDLSKFQVLVYYPGSPEEALKKVFSHANSEYPVYHFFPIHGHINELGKIKGDNKVKTVTISVGSSLGVFKGMNFYMSDQDSWTSGESVAKLTVTNVYSNSAECKVEEGNEEIFNRFQKDRKIKIISNR